MTVYIGRPKNISRQMEILFEGSEEDDKELEENFKDI